MKTALAEELLVKIMEWTPEEVSSERPFLQAIASFKYDSYHQYSMGMRFIESLIRWLDQFDDKEDKNIAYDFIKNKLIFISSEQVSYLVSLAYAVFVEPILVKKAAQRLKIDNYRINKIVKSKEFSKIKRQALFIGLSDGSKIDQFRRSSGINNEQVSPTYFMSVDKINEMIEDLTQEPFCNKEDKFNSIFLIDDFTASGKSYVRFEEGKGKILKFLNSLFQIPDKPKGSLYKLINKSELSINILFYIATEDALNAIGTAIDKWKEKNNINIEIEVQSIQVIKSDVKEEVIKDFDFIRVVEKYFDTSIIDRHYKKGKHDKPYLGFNECALPLILYHNCPNNSLPILWMQEDRETIGLFPRVTRHK